MYLYRLVWNNMDTYGLANVDSCGLAWKRMDLYGMESYGMHLYKLVTRMDSTEFVWTRLVSYRFVWTRIDSYRLV